MLMSSQTRQAHSASLQAGWGSPQLHPLAIVRGSALAGSGGKVFRRMLVMLHEPPSTHWSRQRAHSNMSHRLEAFQGGLACSRETGVGGLHPCLPVPLRAATWGQEQGAARMQELWLFPFERDAKGVSRILVN